MLKYMRVLAMCSSFEGQEDLKAWLWVIDRRVQAEE